MLFRRSMIEQFRSNWFDLVFCSVHHSRLLETRAVVTVKHVRTAYFNLAASYSNCGSIILKNKCYRYRISSRRSLSRSSKIQGVSEDESNDVNTFPSDADDDCYERNYKSYNDCNRDQAKHAYRPNVEPKETTLLLFPGQGSQFVGLGGRLLNYPNVEQMFKTASTILGYDLLAICLNGPKETLDKTIYSQPAVFVTSLAAVEKLREEMPWAIENCVSAAGYSVGEFAALVFAGALTFEDALRFIKTRAEAMQRASECVSSRMMTVFFSADAKVNFACHAARLYCTRELKMEGVVCNISNFLYPGCKVLAGNTEALEFIEKNASEFGIRRVQYLPVSGAFHTKLMLPAKRDLVNAMSRLTLQRPIIPIHSNVNTYQHSSPRTIRRLLVEQMYRPVMWEQTLHVLYSRPQGNNFPYTFEVGPGKHLGAILRKVNKKAYDQYRAIDV